MAEKYRFFAGASGDTREYSQMDFAEVFNLLFRDGVFYGVDNALIVTERTPNIMAVNVGTGQAWIQGYWYKNDATKVLTLDAADATNPRIDRVVLRLDFSTNRTITAAILKGTPAGSPTAPALTRDINTYEIALADIYVGNGVVLISSANITDQRGDPTLCGYAWQKYVGTDNITALQPLAMNNKKITGLATPTDPTDGATKAYADSAFGGSNQTNEILFSKPIGMQPINAGDIKYALDTYPPTIGSILVSATGAEVSASGWQDNWTWTVPAGYASERVFRITFTGTTATNWAVDVGSGSHCQLLPGTAGTYIVNVRAMTGDIIRIQSNHTSSRTANTITITEYTLPIAREVNSNTYTVTGVTYSERWYFYIPRNLAAGTHTLRISFSLYSNNTSYTAYAKLQKNGSDISGTEVMATQATIAKRGQFAFDITVSAGDKIAFLLKSSNASGISYVNDISVHSYDVIRSANTIFNTSITAIPCLNRRKGSYTATPGSYVSFSWATWTSFYGNLSITIPAVYPASSKFIALISVKPGALSLGGGTASEIRMRFAKSGTTDVGALDFIPCFNSGSFAATNDKYTFITEITATGGDVIYPQFYFGGSGGTGMYVWWYEVDYCIGCIDSQDGVVGNFITW